MNALEAVLRQLSPIQRIWIAGATIASALALVAFVSIAGKPDFQAAFTKLSAADAGAISEALRSAKIEFQLADAGATILVPSSSLAGARVAASQAGVLPDAGAPGMELFDKGDFGMTEFDQQVTYQRAQEGELSRVLQSLDGVASARVMIVAEQARLLSENDRPATASVIIAMKDGGQPDRSMVRGIVSTVSGSVAGLSPDNVTVVDEYGRILAGPQLGDASEAMVAQESVERAIEAKVRALVDRAIGPGRSSVAVSARLDRAKVEQQITTYTPVSEGAWTPVSVRWNRETLGGEVTGGSGGIPGVSSNIPGLPTYPLAGSSPTPGSTPAPTASPAPSASPGASASPGPSASPGASASPSPSPTPTASPAAYLSEDVTVNYSLSQKIEKIVQEPGLLERLSVAVLVDEAAASGIPTEQLQAAIEAAIGADSTRGDVVSVTAVAFAEPAPEAATGPLDQVVPLLPQILTTALAVVIGLVLLFLLWRNLRVLGRRSEEALLLAEPPRRHAYPLGPGTMGERASGQDQPSLLAAPALDNSPQAQIQAQVRRVADEKPEALVGLMHGWLREDGTRR